MSSAIKTVIATGTNSGLGFEALKLLLLDAKPYRFILGVRDPSKTKPQLDDLNYDTSKHDVSLIKVDLANLREVQSFAQEALGKLKGDSLDYVLLNAAMANTAKGPGVHGSPWCETYVVNHLSQHYLLHLLRKKIVESQARVIVVSSGAIRQVKDVETLESTLKAGSGADFGPVYESSKFTQLLGAHHWRRTLGSQATVVCVSPGFIPTTGLGRHSAMKLDPNHPDAKSMTIGAKSILAAFTRTDLPKDPNAIFLTSWGEWWDPDEIYPLSLDPKLQDKWSPSKEDIEREAKL